MKRPICNVAGCKRHVAGRQRKDGSWYFRKHCCRHNPAGKVYASQDKRHKQAYWWKYCKLDITPDEYENKLKQQNNCCAICGRPQEEFSRSLAVDHNWDTGQVRSLLCIHCNTTVGLVEKENDLLIKVKDYLEYWDSLTEKAV